MIGTALDAQLPEVEVTSRRRAVRKPIRLMVEYESTEDFLVDYTANLSVGGMFIVTDRPLPKGTLLRMSFRLPGGEETIEATGQVRWAVQPSSSEPMRPGMGISFEELGDLDRARVQALLMAWG